MAGLQKEPSWVADEARWRRWYQQQGHTAWESVEEIRRRWSAVTLSDGTPATVPWQAGYALHYAKWVCEEIGARYRIEWFNWMEPKRYVCIRVFSDNEQRLCLSSADCFGDLQLGFGTVRTWLSAHRDSLVGKRRSKLGLRASL